MPIKPIFDPVIPEHKLRERKHYRWSEIQKAKAGVPQKPRAWINPDVIPYLKPTRLNQDQRGTCTGYATVMGQYLLDKILLMKEIPTSADISAIRRDQQIHRVGWTCTMFWDKLVDQMPSMQFAYEMGRREEWPDPADRPPEGGMVGACVRMWKKVGWVPETWCRTAKTPNCVPMFDNDLGISEAQIMEEAAKHVLEGYAICDTIEEIADAIWTSYQEKKGGFALVGVNILADYQNVIPKTVDGRTVYIYPGKSGENVGGHAQCIVGYDLDQGLVVVAASWETDDKIWPFLNGWDRNYHVANASAAFVPIDTTDVAVGQATYSTVIINANVPAHFKVDDQAYLDQPAKISLVDGQLYTITAYPLQPAAVVEAELSRNVVPLKANEVPDTDGKPIIPVDFIFTPAPGPNPDPTPTPPNPPGPGLIDLIRAIIRAILKIFGIGG